MSDDLHQRLNVQWEEGEKLMAIIEGMHHREGLDFSTMINTSGYEKIYVYLLQSGFEQTLEKLMAKNPNLDLSCLDHDDVPMQDVEPKDKVVEEAKGLEKADRDIDMAAGSKQAGRQIVGSEPRVEPEIAGSGELE